MIIFSPEVCAHAVPHSSEVHKGTKACTGFHSGGALGGGGGADFACAATAMQQELKFLFSSLYIACVDPDFLHPSFIHSSPPSCSNASHVSKEVRYMRQIAMEYLADTQDIPLPFSCDTPFLANP